MPSLLGLPAELLRGLFSVLPTESLLSLCLTCKSLHVHAEHVLYESISCVLENESTNEPSSPSSADLLLRTLWYRPDLAALVRHARFGTSRDVQWDEGPSDIPPLNDFADYWHHAIRQLDASLQGALEHEVLSGNVGGMTAVLLSRLTGLRTLELEYSLVCCSQSIAKVLSTSSSMEPISAVSCFRSLKELKVVNDLDSTILRQWKHDLQDWGIPQTMLSFFSLQSLETVELILPKSDLESWTPHQCINSLDLTNLMTLGVLHAGAKPEVLANMLSHTPNLSTLEYFFAQNLEDLKYDSYYKLDYTDEWLHFTRALGHVSSSLRNLVISVDYAVVDDYPPEEMDVRWVNGVWERQGRLGSLKHMVALERVEAPTFVLIGWRWTPTPGQLAAVLPARLRELCLRDDLIERVDYQWTPWNANVTGWLTKKSFWDTCDPTELIRQLQQFLRATAAPPLVGQNTIGLERLCLKVQKDRIWPEKYLQQVEAMCRQSGVEATVRMRESGFLTWTKEWNDNIKEITLRSELSQVSGEGLERYPWRRLEEPRRQFRENS